MRGGTDRFYHVDLKDWVYGTIDKVRNDGEQWNDAWLDTYRELGGRSVESGKKSCPKCAAKTLYEFGHIEDTDRPFRECEIPKLWRTPGYKNGVYAIIAIRLLSQNRNLDEAALWREIKKIVRAETGEKPAASNQGGPTLARQLWELGLIRRGSYARPPHTEPSFADPMW